MSGTFRPRVVGYSKLHLLADGCDQSSFSDDFSGGTPGQPLEAPWSNNGYGPRYTDPPGAESYGQGSSAGTYIPALAECCDVDGQTIIVEGEWDVDGGGSNLTGPALTFNDGVAGGFAVYIQYVDYYGSLYVSLVPNTGGETAFPIAGAYVPVAGDPLNLSLSVTPTEITFAYELDGGSLVAAVTVTPAPDMVAAQRLGFLVDWPYYGQSSVVRSFVAECGSLAAGTDEGIFDWGGD